MTAFSLMAAILLISPENSQAAGFEENASGMANYRQRINHNPPPPSKDLANSEPQIKNHEETFSMGGFFSGMFMGGLIGHIFMNRHFTGVSILDLLIICLLLYLIWRFFRSGHPIKTPRTVVGNVHPAMFNPLKPYSVLNDPQEPLDEAKLKNLNPPPDFLPQEFIEKARLLFVRLQAAWSIGDMDDISLFVSGPALEDIKRMDQSRDSFRGQEILRLKADLLELRQENDRLKATIKYEILMRREASPARPNLTKEIWRLSRPINQRDDWRMDARTSLSEL